MKKKTKNAQGLTICLYVYLPQQIKVACFELTSNKKKTCDLSTLSKLCSKKEKVAHCCSFGRVVGGGIQALIA